MAFVLNDRVKETTTTTGTGTINLGGAATGFETFVAGIGNSNVTYYCIAGQGTAEFEVGIGTVTDASPDTLSRTTILSSSNSDSAVDFSAGTKDVFCTLPASKTIRELDTALNVPTGTTAQRASSPAAGDLRFNTTSSKFEGYSGSAWGNIGEGNFLVTNIFAGDGSDTTFTISNAVADENNLLVFIDGVFQAHDSYSVSGTTVTFSTAPANGRVITIYSALNNVQGADMVIATMTGDNSDTTLALGVTPVSENNVQVYIDGTYQNKDTYSISGQTLTFSTAPPTGTAVEAITHTVTDISAAASNILVDEFTGDGSDTTFTLSAAPTNENNTQVFVGGVYQEKATYSISNAVLTFTAAPANGVSIEVVSIAVGQINSAVQLSDADGDTKVMVEESSDEDKIRFDTGGTERMVIDSTGVGIGQVPTRDLSLHAGDASSVFAHFTNTDTGTTSSDGLLIGLGSSEDLVLNNQESSKNIIFENGGSERMRIDADGNLGLGQSSPNNETNRVSLELNDTWGGVFQNSVSGTPKSEWRWNTSGHTIFGSVANEDLAFVSNNAEVMRIDTSGNLLIGNGSTTYGNIKVRGSEFIAIGSGDTNLEFNFGSDQVNPSSGTAARDNAIDLGSSSARFDDIYATNGTIQTSDQNEKNTITNSDLGLDFINKLSPKSYKFNGKTRTHYGLIAQDVETVLSDISKSTTDFAGFIKDDISEEQDGSELRYGLRYTEFVSPLVKAIQEQQNIIEDLKARIETLEGG